MDAPDLNIPRQLPSRPAGQPAPLATLPQALRGEWADPFTPMANARARSADGTTVSLLVLRGHDKEYDTDVTAEYEEMRDEAVKLSRFFRTRHPSPLSPLSNESLAEMIGHMIWGSNMIEHMGDRFRRGPTIDDTVHADHDMTVTICRWMFSTKHRGFRNIKPTPAFLAEAEKHIQECFDNYGLPTDAAMVRQRFLLVVNHALAAMHVIDHVVLQDNDLDGEVVLDANRVLTQGLTTVKYPGIIPDPNMIKLREVLDRLFCRFRQELQIAIAAGRMDPVALAAEFCQVAYGYQVIYGGDGRLSRLVLSTLLLKYGNLIVPIGTTERSCTEYQAVALRAQDRVLKYVDGKGDDSRHLQLHSELSTLLLRHVHETIKKWRKKLEADEQSRNRRPVVTRPTGSTT